MNWDDGASSSLRRREDSFAVASSNGASPSRNPLRAAWQQNGNARSGLALVVRLYALVEADDPEAIDVYLREEDAQRALEGACVTSRIGAGC